MEKQREKNPDMAGNGPEAPGALTDRLDDIFTRRPPKDEESHYILSENDKKMIFWLLDENNAENNDFGKYASNFSKETLEAIHLAANSGDSRLFDAALRIVMEGYKKTARQMIGTKYHVTGYDDGEDMMQAFYITLWQNLKKFDPKISTNILNCCYGDLSQSMIRESMDISGMGIKKKRSYINNNKRIQDAVNELHSLGVEDPTAPQIADMINLHSTAKTKISVYTVETTMKMFSLSKADFEKTLILKESDRPEDNPEGMLLKGEEADKFWSFYQSQYKKRRDLLDCLLAVYEEDDRESSLKEYESDLEGKEFKERKGWNGRLPYTRIVRRFAKQYPSDNESEINRELRALLGDLGRWLSEDGDNGRYQKYSQYHSSKSYTGIVFDYDLFKAQQEDVAASIEEDPEGFFDDADRQKALEHLAHMDDIIF